MYIHMCIYIYIYIYTHIFPFWQVSQSLPSWGSAPSHRYTDDHASSTNCILCSIPIIIFI